MAEKISTDENWISFRGVLDSLVAAGIWALLCILAVTLWQLPLTAIPTVSLCTALLALTIAVWSILGPRRIIKADRLAANRFELRDANGKIRGALAMTPDGELGLQLGDYDQTRRITLSITRDGRPMLGFFDAKGDSLVALGVITNDHWGLSFADGRSGKPLFSMGMNHGRPALTMYGRDGKGRVSMGLAENGSPGLTFDDEHRKRRVVISLDKMGVPSLVLADDEGQIIWAAR